MLFLILCDVCFVVTEDKNSVVLANSNEGDKGEWQLAPGCR